MRTRFLWFVVIAGLLVTTLAPWASGQNQLNPDKIAAIKARFDQMKSSFSQMPPNHRALIAGQTHLLQAAHMFDQVVAGSASGKPFSRKGVSSKGSGAAADPNLASVNDNSTDLDFSSFDGVTQSTTSTAKCGNQVVVGFNDYGSFLQTIFGGPGGESLTGAAVSSDGGRTFRDIGFINPGSDFNNALSGNPSLACSDSSTFYYTQAFFASAPPFGESAIALSKSTDGANTWGDPQVAVGKQGCAFKGFLCFVIHILDMPSSAIDPTNPQRMYVTYTDFDTSNTSPGCGKQTRTAIELVISNDGGQSFGNPIIIDEQCGNNVGVQASHVAFNSHSVAYVAWERLTPGNAELRVTRVAPDGTVAPSVAVNQKVFGGDTFAVFRAASDGFIDFETDLQGQFRDLFGLSLAVDHSGGPNDGTVYVTWDDARNKSVPDLAGFKIDAQNPQGTLNQLIQRFPNAQIDLPFVPPLFTGGSYGYTDVLVSSSKDGVHFGPPVQVNSDLQPKVGGGHDHFQPAIATDSTGQVAICWYDRRNDPQNLQIERFCAESRNGSNWSNFRVPIAPFAPIHRLDFAFNFFNNTAFNVQLDYMGDYDGLTSDFTGKTGGFIGAFQWMSSGMNPDVKAYRFE